MVRVLSEEDKVVGEDKILLVFLELGKFGEAIDEEMCETLELCEWQILFVSTKISGMYYPQCIISNFSCLWLSLYIFCIDKQSFCFYLNILLHFF